MERANRHFDGAVFLQLAYPLCGPIEHVVDNPLVILERRALSESEGDDSRTARSESVDGQAPILDAQGCARKNADKDRFVRRRLQTAMAAQPGDLGVAIGRGDVPEYNGAEGEIEGLAIPKRPPQVVERPTRRGC